MAWVVQLDFDDGEGWRDITDLVLTETFMRDRSLWNELSPNINTLRFDMLWDSTIVTALLNTDNEVAVNVTKDGVDYFTGIVRTNWQFSLTTRPQAVKIECVDKGILLKEKKVKPVTPTLLEGYSVGDTGDTDNSLIHQLLYGAGFSSAEINITTIGDTIDYFPYVESDRTYWDVLDTLLFEYHRVFYFDESGRFSVYDWSPASVSTGDTFDNGNMVGELKIKKMPEKYEAMQIQWYDRDTLTDQIVFSDTTDGNQTHKCSIVLAAGEYYPVGSDSHSVYADYKVEGREIIAVKDAYVDKIIGDSISENAFTSYYTKAQIEYENKSAAPEYIYKLDIVGDAVVKGDFNVTKRENTSGTTKLLDYKAEYIHTSLAAQRLVRGLGRYYEYADFTYEIRSGDSVVPGDYVSVVESNFLNINNTCVVVGRRDNEQVGEYFYTLEGISEYNVGDTVSADGGVSSPFPNQSRDYIVVGASGYAGSADYYCDGDTDETEINAAITFANANNIGTVNLVGGTFYTTATINLADNIIFELNSCTITKESGYYAITVYECSDSSILNGIINETATGTYANGGISVSTSENITIMNINAYRCSRGIYVHSSSTNINIYGCRINDSRDYGIYVASGCKVSVTNNYISGSPDDPLTYDQPLVGMAIGTDAECVVQNNKIIGCPRSGISVLAGDNCNISGNDVEDCGWYSSSATKYYGIIVNASSEYNAILANRSWKNGNLISYGLCENNTYPPQIDGNVASNATATRGDTEAYEGTYSYKINKDNAAGTAAHYYLTDNADPGDMHGFVAGVTYKMTMRVFIPSSGMTGTEMLIGLSDGVLLSTQAAANTYDEWQEVTLTKTLDAGATRAWCRVSFESTAAEDEYFYIDNVRIVPLGLGNDHDTNFSDSGTGTVVSGNSWQ